MKRIRFFLLLLGFIIIYLSSRGQSAEDSLRFAGRILSLKKKAIIVQHFKLTEAEKSAFWPIYNKFDLEIEDYDIEYFHLLSRYVAGINELPDRTLQELSERFLQNDIEVARIRKQYYKKFKKALSTSKASEFMQLDNTFRAMVRLEMQKDPTPFEILYSELLTRHN